MNKTKKTFISLVLLLVLIYLGVYTNLRMTKYFIGGSSVYYKTPEDFYRERNRKEGETNRYRMGGQYVYHMAPDTELGLRAILRRPTYVQRGVFYHKVILPGGYTTKDILYYYLFYPCTRSESFMRNMLIKGANTGEFIVLAIFINLSLAYCLLGYFRR